MQSHKEPKPPSEVLKRDSNADFIKKQTPTLLLSCELCDIFKSTDFEKHLGMIAFQRTQLGNKCHYNENFLILPSLTLKYLYESKSTYESERTTTVY